MFLPHTLPLYPVSEDNPFWIQEDGGDHYNWFLDTAMVGNPEVAMIFHPGGLQAPGSNDDFNFVVGFVPLGCLTSQPDFVDNSEIL